MGSVGPKHYIHCRTSSRFSWFRTSSRFPCPRSPCAHTQDRGRARPLKRRVEVSMRNLTREDRDAFTAAKQKEWASWLDQEAVELVKDRLKAPRSHILRARWEPTWKNVGTEKVPKARLCALWISGRASHIISDPDV